jgi:hypothetical protein
VTGEFLHPAFLGYSGKNKFLHIYLMHKILNLTSNNNKHDRQLPPATRWMYTVPQHNQHDNRHPQRKEIVQKNFAAPTLHLQKPLASSSPNKIH